MNDAAMSLARGSNEDVATTQAEAPPRTCA